MTEERLAELERLKAELDAANAAEESFNLSTELNCWRYPGQGHPQYAAYRKALDNYCYADHLYSEAAMEALPGLIAEVRRLQALLSQYEAS